MRNEDKSSTILTLIQLFALLRLPPPLVRPLPRISLWHYWPSPSCMQTYTLLIVMLLSVQLKRPIIYLYTFC